MPEGDLPQESVDESPSKGGIHRRSVIGARVVVRMGIVGAIVFEITHEGGVITDRLGIEGFQALVLKHPLRHLAAGDQLTRGAGDDAYNGGAPILGVGGHLILLNTLLLR
jgi:hypothetical protein